MRNFQTSLIIVGFLGLGLLGCASSAYNHAVTDKVSQEGGITSRADLQAETSQLIKNDPNLTNEQRTQLTALGVATRAEMTKLSQNSLKLRSVLIKELLSEDYDRMEVGVIKKRLQKTENERLELIFAAAEKANKILGRQAVVHQRLVNEMFDHSDGMQK